MEIIKPLSEDVHSMVRSGFIIDCLSTVVEELIYNSLDADATKVAVTVAVNNGYVKVEDDGFGITRSGLVLLGERYATSKLQNFHEKDDVMGSFGFRGEVLCSIADVSLVEIITRVQGRPNGYRKVMKGRKCLCLSIDNDRLAVGTTVIVRDLFYNQPVRRRQMQCSAKKVLHSVKKSAVQIALVQPKVSFKVIDMESEDELLSTRCCPSPLTLLCSNFGIEASGLQELSFSEGPLKLKGYVSMLSSSFSSKAVQYIYVNSRFVDKGPIHKVLNRLAEMCLDQLRGGSGVKKSQPQGPLYCLNLACPRYSYDLNLEFSRASVEFKDWASVLTFVEKSVMSLWREEIKRGSFHNHEADQIRKGGKENVVEKDMWLKSCETSTKRRRTQKSENQRVCTKEALELQVEDCKSFSPWKNTSRQCMNSESISVNFGESKTKESLHQMGITGASHASHTNCIYDVEDGIGSQLLEPEKRLVFEDFLGNGITTSMVTEATYANDCFPSPRLKEEDSIDYPYGGCHEVGSFWSFNLMSKTDSNSVNEDQELHLQGTSWENPIETPLDFVKESQFPIYNFNSKQSISNFHGNRDADSVSQNSDIFLSAQCESEVANSWPLPESGIEICTRNHVDTGHLGCDKSLSSCGGFFDREYPLESSNKRDKVLLPCSETNFCQQTAATCPILKLKDWDIENLIENEGSERRLGVRNCDGIEQLYYDRDDFYHSGLDDSSSNRNLFSTRSLNTNTLFTTEYAGVGKSAWELSPPGHNVDETASIRSESFQDINSPSMDRRHKDSTFCWSPLTSDKGIEMDLQGCPELKLENILIENTKRIYDSPDGLLTNRCDSMVGSETFSPNLDPQIKSSSFKPSVYWSSAISAGKGPEHDLPRCQVFEPHQKISESKCSLRSRRSHSAPPFYRGKKRFLSVSSSLTTTTENSALQTASQVSTVSEKMQSKNPPKLTLPRRVNPQDDEIRFGENSLFCLEQKVKEISNITPASSWSHDGNREAACFSSGYLMEVQDSENLRTKWRDGCPDASLKDISKCLTAGDRLNDLKDENGILDIQSCMLDLAGDSLVPKSINRSALQNAKVLWQIDNKYIPVVAGGTLAVIDQHAADERIRLEEMRQKVLFNEMKSIHYLEKEKDLVLPEISYQLLCNYAEHIKHWGWICNIFSQDSGSFAKNLNLLNERESNLTLVAVPCILGVSLSDADLVEFLEQLAGTDGSSTIPPSVVRILNYKACRGAIMFGDKLLPSECSLIVEELKKTSLCFQCAHGRPTTVPLVNLKALHKAILHLGLWCDRSNDTWHGHCRKKITLDRAKHRLEVARGCG